MNSLGTILKLSKNTDPTKDPEVVLALKRMHRKIGRHQKQAIPLTRDHLKQLLSNCSNDLKGLCNQVLLQLGYETMRRRSELCAFKFEDLVLQNNSKPILHLRRSKTDQQAVGSILTISSALWNLIQLWRTRIKVDNGFILRAIDKHGNVGVRLSPGAIPIILNTLAQSTTPYCQKTGFSGHSFRVGAALDLLNSGETLEKIMLKGGWSSESSALRYLAQYNL